MENTKRCPYCGEKIMASAKKCRHCKEWLVSQIEQHGNIPPSYESFNNEDNAEYMCEEEFPTIDYLPSWLSGKIKWLFMITALAVIINGIQQIFDIDITNIHSSSMKIQIVSIICQFEGPLFCLSNAIIMLGIYLGLSNINKGNKALKTMLIISCSMLFIMMLFSFPDFTEDGRINDEDMDVGLIFFLFCFMVVVFAIPGYMIRTKYTGKLCILGTVFIVDTIFVWTYIIPLVGNICDNVIFLYILKLGYELITGKQNESH